MSGDHKKTHNKADPDEENLSDSLLGVLRSSRGNRHNEEQRLEKLLQKMMDEKIKQLVAETNIPQLIQEHASKGENSFQVDINSYCVPWEMKVTNGVYNITLERKLHEFLQTLLNILNNEELSASLYATCGRYNSRRRASCKRTSHGQLRDGRVKWTCGCQDDRSGSAIGDFQLCIRWR